MLYADVYAAYTVKWTKPIKGLAVLFSFILCQDAY